MKDEFEFTLDHVLGKDSIAWTKWLEQMGNKAKVQDTDTGTFIIAACTAVLLQLGPPPHPEWLTTDTTQIYPHPKFRSRHERIAYETRMKSVMSAQFRWNKEFNSWVIGQRVHGSSQVHGPAQLRKFFAAWWLLHRCKKHDYRDKVSTSPLAELAATRDALEKQKRVLHRAAVRARPTAKNVS